MTSGEDQSPEEASTLAGGVFRLQGVAESNGSRMEWSVIRKRLLPATMMVGDVEVPRSASSSFDYWRREADAYAPGSLEDLGGVHMGLWLQVPAKPG